MSGIWGETKEEKLQRLHNEGQKEESDGTASKMSTIIYRDLAFNEEEKAAYEAGMKAARDQKKS